MNHKAVRIAVVIPAYNEEKAIAGVIEQVRDTALASGLELVPVVVNDCSADDTVVIARDKGCVLLDLPVNLGIGGAVQTGFLYAREQGFTHAVQVDGDGQHPVENIAGLYRCMEEKSCDVVIGSRFISKTGFQSSRLRRAGIWWFGQMAALLTRYRIRDSTSGFRLLNRKALEAVCEEYPDDYPEPEALIIYSRYGLRVEEIGVEMKARSGGVSSIGAFQAFYYMWKVSLGILFCFLKGKPVQTRI